MSKWSMLLLTLILASTPAIRAEEAEKTNWFDRISLSGDFRYRHEVARDKDPANDDKGTHNRQRIRARVQLDAQVNDEFTATIRIASGSSSAPTSTNQTLEDKFSEKDLWLDEAFLTYSPLRLSGFSALAGKMPRPFIAVGKNQLIWDNDVTFEGMAVNYLVPLGSRTELGFNGGGFWLEEDWSTSATDQYLWGFQALLNQELGKLGDVTAGASYYDFVHVEGMTGYNSGNTESSGALVNDYNLLELFAEWSTRLGALPVALYGSWVNNRGTVSGQNEDTGYLFGIKVNKADQPGTWQAGYQYRDVEKDAVVGYFTDSDFVGGGTTGLASGGIGSSGHKITCAYQLAKYVQAAATCFLADQKTDTRDYAYNSLLLDLVIKIR